MPLKDDRGITLVETILAASFTGLIVLAVSHYGKIPQLLSHSMNAALVYETPVKALDLLANDLKEADYSSFPFGSMDPATGAIPGWWRVNHYSQNPPYVYIHYEFQAGSTGTTGSLVRCFNTANPSMTGATCKSFLTNVETPSTSALLFQRDSTFPNVLTVTIFYRPAWTEGSQAPAAFKIVRRASIRS